MRGNIMSRTESNRRNAQHSTGPKTPEGKQRSSLNALRHGLTGQIVVMPHEDLAAYQRHVKSFTTEFQPQGAAESNLVQGMADATWRLNRVASMEATLLALTAAHQPDPVQEALAIAASPDRQVKVMSSLGIHGQRLSRQYQSTLRQLLELQKIRHDREKRELDQLVDIIEMYKSKGKVYIPADDGFVFTEDQIKQAIRARNRERLAKEAYHYRLKSAAA
jgi:hypothetical protein